MRAKILSKKSENNKYFLIIDDIIDIIIYDSSIVFHRNISSNGNDKNSELYRAYCNDEQSFNIQLSAEKGELIDLTELNVEVFCNDGDYWILI